MAKTYVLGIQVCSWSIYEHVYNTHLISRLKQQLGRQILDSSLYYFKITTYIMLIQIDPDPEPGRDLYWPWSWLKLIQILIQIDHDLI